MTNSLFFLTWLGLGPRVSWIEWKNKGESWKSLIGGWSREVGADFGPPREARQSPERGRVSLAQPSTRFPNLNFSLFFASDGRPRSISFFLRDVLDAPTANITEKSLLPVPPLSRDPGFFLTFLRKWFSNFKIWLNWMITEILEVVLWDFFRSQFLFLPSSIRLFRRFAFRKWVNLTPRRWSVTKLH